jgi:hypothetical protein
MGLRNGVPQIPELGISFKSVVVFSLRLLYPREQQSVFTGQKAG